MTNLRAVIQEAVTQELQEIFGIFGKPKTPTTIAQGPGSTEKFAQEPAQSLPTEKFSLLALKQLKTSKEIRTYVRKTLKALGTVGQARAVYEIDNERILKIALSDNKTYQNKNEVQNAKCIGPTYAVQVFSYHPLYYWIVEERVTPITSGAQITQKFNELTNLSKSHLVFTNSSDIQAFLTEMPRLLAKKSDNPGFQQRHDFLISNNPWYQGLVEKLSGCKVASWDFHKDNWGIRPSTGDLVLLDLGFNQAASSPEEEFFKEAIDMAMREKNEHGFNMDELRSLNTMEEVQNYCSLVLGNEFMIGAQRWTWVIDDDSVIKVAHGKKGTFENQNEIKNAKCLGEKYAVKVLDYDHEQFLWIIEERIQAYPTAFVSPEFVGKINSILGTDYDDWFPIMQLFFCGTDPEKDKLIAKNEWFRGIVKALEQCDVGSHDLHPGNWGIRPSTGELVILDLGF